MRKLEKHAYIMKFVVAYRCSECGREFKVSVKQRVTGIRSGPPPDLVKAFEGHVCGATKETDKAK